MGVAIVGFVFPHSMQSMLEENFTDKIIHTYRDDLDLQNFIDFAQQEVNIQFNKIIGGYFINYSPVPMLWSEHGRLHGLVEK